MAANRKVGWHNKRRTAPHKGKGSATVQAIKSRKSILAIRRHLNDRPRDKALFVVGINWGLRGGDLVQLRWSDVLTAEGDLKQSITIRESKNQNLRRISINGRVKNVLLPLLDEYTKRGEGVFLFPSRKRKLGQEQPMTVVRLHQLVNEWCEAVGLDGHWGSHTLRKTFGYWAYKQGISLGLLMSIFGHSSEAITKRYIGIDDEQQKEVYLKLDL